jgi:hypothetical protein
MKSIATKYSAASYRITANDGDGNRITISRESTANLDECHKQAAITLCKKMGWTGKLQGGYTKDGMAWNFNCEYLKAEI